VTRPVLLCSPTAWERDAPAPELAQAVELLPFVAGHPLDGPDLARVELAHFSADLYPATSLAFLRSCIDAPNLRWLHLFNAGVDHPIFTSFLDRGVRLTTSSGASATPIAHHVAMCLLALARDLPGSLRRQAAHDWEPRRADDVEGRTVGIVGMGPIGCETARLADALGMRAVGVRRTVRGDEPCETWTLDRLPELLPIVDDLVLALPLTDGTRGLVGAAELGRLRRGARLVNVGRGELVDEDALVDALRSGHLGGAALDVFRTEPLPATSPLWDLPNVIVSPHSSGDTPLTEIRAGQAFVDNLGRWVRGERLRNEVVR